MSTSWEVQGICEVHFGLFRSVPGAVRDALHHHHCHVRVDLDSAWKVWCSSAEEGLLAAYRAAGGPLSDKALCPSLVINSTLHSRIHLTFPHMDSLPLPFSRAVIF